MEYGLTWSRKVWNNGGQGIEIWKSNSGPRMILCDLTVLLLPFNCKVTRKFSIATYIFLFIFSLDQMKFATDKNVS